MIERKIGDKVWVARLEGSARLQKECPDCLGKKYIRLIMGDNEHVSIPCEGCSHGFGTPAGEVSYYGSQALALEGYIGQITITVTKVEYQVGLDGYNISPDIVFDDEASAQAEADRLLAEHQERQDKRIISKEKNHKSWAWHASYYRGKIRRAEDDINLYRDKLNYAEKVKRK